MEEAIKNLKYTLLGSVLVGVPIIWIGTLIYLLAIESIWSIVMGIITFILVFGFIAGQIIRENRRDF